MPISHFSKTFAIEDAKIAKLTADPSGGAAAYAALVDVPGIKSITLGGAYNVQELRGDNQLLDVMAVLQNVTVGINAAKLSLDVLPVWMGGTTTDSGVTPNQKATYAHLGTNTPSYWKLEGKTPTNGGDVVGGDVHILLYKLILASFPAIGFAEETYQIPAAEARALPRLADNKWFDVVFNETAAAIA